ncbi:DUF6011 domain-containing protein [Amycolatopsis sp. CFH S0078]|uniref:DUF6011 domain-containing protein n=1 Tax=Amycolatopsis sp. CFH S0078 TaxID=1644108 RepID=UPI00106E6ABF|nr:DUF6011 domain-containing protein [Amycolatopsis sp. CFH S0078]
MTDRCQAPKCGRRLKTDESKARGYGPVCWSRINPAAPVIPAPGHAADPNQIPLPLENPVDAETRKAAIDVLARRQLAEDVRDAEGRTTVTYSRISAEDTEAVAARVLAIVESIRPSDEQYAAARDHLADSVSAKADSHPDATVQEGQDK